MAYTQTHSTAISTPDAQGAGLTDAALDPLRYDGHTDAPYEVAGMLRQLLPERVRVLDVGCGTGSVTVIVNRDKHNEVRGIEPDQRRAAVARSRGIDVFCGMLTPAYLGQHGPFDVIMFADVLEHLPDPAGMLALADGGLKAGGHFLISVPNVAHWSIRLDLLRGRFDYADCGIRDATHLRWFTQRTLEHLLHSQGLQVVTLRHTAGTELYDYAARRPWKWLARGRRDRLVRSLSRRLPLLFGCQHIVLARKP